jgi:hypothetical protein
MKKASASWALAEDDRDNNSKQPLIVFAAPDQQKASLIGDAS